MRKTIKILKLSFFVVTFFLHLEVYANPIGNWYAGGFLGAAVSTSGDTTIPAFYGKPPLTSEPVYKRGGVIGLNVGYSFNRLFRIEGEVAYQYLPMDKVNNAVGEGTVTHMKDSSTSLFSLFMNGYYDFKSFQHWQPYVGVGIGYVEVRNTLKPDPPIFVAPGLYFTDKNLDYNTFAYQGIIGLDYKLTGNVILGMNYKYFSTFEKQVRGQTNLGPDSYETKQTITNNILSLEIRYFFN